MKKILAKLMFWRKPAPQGVIVRISTDIPVSFGGD